MAAVGFHLVCRAKVELPEIISSTREDQGAGVLGTPVETRTRRETYVVQEVPPDEYARASKASKDIFTLLQATADAQVARELTILRGASSQPLPPDLARLGQRYEALMGESYGLNQYEWNDILRALETINSNRRKAVAIHRLQEKKIYSLMHSRGFFAMIARIWFLISHRTTAVKYYNKFVADSTIDYRALPERIQQAWNAQPSRAWEYQASIGGKIIRATEQEEFSADEFGQARDESTTIFHQETMRLQQLRQRSIFSLERLLANLEYGSSSVVPVDIL